MAVVVVSRQVVDKENNLSWEYFEIDESELLEGEAPLPDWLLKLIGYVYKE